VNLQPVLPPRTPRLYGREAAIRSFILTCCKCGRRVELLSQGSMYRMYADLDGGSFQAYYCERCVSEQLLT
jgi:hypothetical protein